VKVCVYRRLDDRIQNLPPHSPLALELHRRRAEALQDVFSNFEGAEVLDWGLTHDNVDHEFVELILGTLGAASFNYVIVPGLEFVGKKLLDAGVDTVVGEFVKAFISRVRPKQEAKQILDFEITLPDGTTVAVDPPDRNASVTVTTSDGTPHTITYRSDQV
jgi:hypothetical protein